MISFIVPAHNEEPLLGQTLAALRAAADGVDHEIIVVDDASTDRTAAIARAAGARVVPIERRQISAARNAGAAQARGDLFVFVDADTLISRAVVDQVLEAVQRGACAGGAPVRMDEPAPAYAKAMLAILLWVFRHLRLACGCFMFATRRAFTATTGFDERVYVSEEVGMSRALGRQGRFVTVRTPVVTSARKIRTYSFLRDPRDHRRRHAARTGRAPGPQPARLLVRDAADRPGGIRSGGRGSIGPRLDPARGAGRAALISARSAPPDAGDRTRPRRAAGRHASAAGARRVAQSGPRAGRPPAPPDRLAPRASRSAK